MDSEGQDDRVMSSGHYSPIEPEQVPGQQSLLQAIADLAARVTTLEQQSHSHDGKPGLGASLAPEVEERIAKLETQFATLRQMVRGR
jgi:hypothetical protein